MARRIAATGVVMALCFAALLVQLTNVQVVKARQYADSQHNPAVALQRFSKARGRIVLPDGTILAQSVPTTGTGSSYKYMRVYTEPYASAYADVLGFDSLLYGNYGVEQSYNQYLVSHNAPVKTIGDLLSTHVVTDDVTLTLDRSLQQAAVQALGGVNGTVGEVVALDPSTGEVRAMYGNPTFDPNQLASLDTATEEQAWSFNTAPDHAEDGYRPLTPMPLQVGYPPGSTMKTVTTAAAYDHNPDLISKPYPSVSCFPLPNGDPAHPLCNFANGTCGGDIAQMLPPSCDTGYGMLGLDIGGANLMTEAASFGFNQQPPIDLPHSPFEISNYGGPPPPGSQPSFLLNDRPFQAYSAIGQGNDNATALQMAMVASAFANNGVIMAPHVVKVVYDSDGNLVYRYNPTPWKTATSPATAQAVSGLMQQVAQVGTAAGIFDPADDVAAKTGTAETANGRSTTDWMIAFAPASAPKIALAVVIPNQPGGHNDFTGAAIAGPIMRQMITAALGR